MINSFLICQHKTYTMTYNLNWDYWVKYFKGNISQGLQGNSPASFSRSNLFFDLGVLQF